MTKTIDTLAADIKGLFGQTLRGDSHKFEEEVLAKFGSQVALHVADTLRARTGKRKPNTLYMSEIGKPCLRLLWYSHHFPGLAEPMQEHTLFKFLYGDIIEEVALLLAEAAGHKVEHRQLPVELEYYGWKIRGRIDAMIDGVLVDAKSCSPYGFKKFQEGLSDENDSFGYRSQLSGYQVGLLANHNMSAGAGFLAIDKQNGHVGYFPVEYNDPLPQIRRVIGALEGAVPPPRQFALVPEGKSGNEKLCTECSYCPFKHECWADANMGEGLKAYAYSYGPVFLGTTVRPPRVPELHLQPARLAEVVDAEGAGSR